MADVAVDLRGGLTVRVHECHEGSWEGGNVWSPARELVAVLNRSPDVSAEVLKSARVLELGAGCGLVGLSAALLGAQHVVLSDVAVALPTLCTNVATNGLVEGRDGVEVGALDWTADDDQPLLSGRTFDLIIASACIYDVDMAEPLLRTAHRACRRDGTFLLAGIIGGEAVKVFRSHVLRYFEECVALPPTDSPELGPPPTPRAVHRIRAPRMHVCPEPNAHVTHLLGGLSVWPAAFALADALCASTEWRALLPNARVIELGAGCAGHVGIAAARMGNAGTRVDITDKDAALVECCARAVRDNHVRGQCTAGIYSWGEESALVSSARPYDVVLASDCIYSHGVAGAFCDALDALVGPSTRVLVSCEDRWSSSECRDVCAERGWTFVRMGPSFRPSVEQLARVSERVREQGVADSLCFVYEVVRGG